MNLLIAKNRRHPNKLSTTIYRIIHKVYFHRHHFEHPNKRVPRDRLHNSQDFIRPSGPEELWTGGPAVLLLTAGGHLPGPPGQPPLLRTSQACGHNHIEGGCGKSVHHVHLFSRYQDRGE